MNSRILLVLAGMAVTPFTTLALQDSTSTNLTCEERNVSYDDTEQSIYTSIGKIEVKLDTNGTPQSIKVTRAKLENQPAFEINFTKEKSKITQEIVDTGENPETGECLTSYCIPKVETITATNPNGDSVTIKINDHNYAGVPGSTTFYKVNGVEMNSALSNSEVTCSGRARLPWNSASSLELEDELLD